MYTIGPFLLWPPAIIGVWNRICYANYDNAWDFVCPEWPLWFALLPPEYQRREHDYLLGVLPVRLGVVARFSG